MIKWLAQSEDAPCRVKTHLLLQDACPDSAIHLIKDLLLKVPHAIFLVALETQGEGAY